MRQKGRSSVRKHAFGSVGKRPFSLYSRKRLGQHGVLGV
jgi:hypothetical protein